MSQVSDPEPNKHEKPDPAQGDGQVDPNRVPNPNEPKPGKHGK
jgi:hypothetical protein